MACELYGYSCEGVGALSSAVIAVFAFFATVWQAWVSRKHARLSVKPLINTWTETGHFPNGYEVRLNNIGIGPALIDCVEIYVDGQRVEGQGHDLVRNALKRAYPTSTPSLLYSSYLSKGGVVAAGTGIVLARMQFVASEQMTQEAFDEMNRRVKLVVKYKSIYQDKTFTYDSEVGRPVA